MEIFHDQNNFFSIKSPPSLNDFKENTSFLGLRNYNVWSLVTVKNIYEVKKEFMYAINFNHQAKNEVIDFLIYKNDKLVEQKIIKINQKEFAIFNESIRNILIEIEPNETIKILSLINSKSMIQPNLIIEKDQYFDVQTLYVILIWGMYYSLLAFLLIYNISNFLITKNRLSLYHSALLILSSINFCSYNDIFFQYIFFIELNIVPPWLIISILSLLMLCFIRTYFINIFSSKENYKKLIVLISFQLILIFMALINYFYFYTVSTYMLNIVLFLIYASFFIYTISFLVIGIVIFKKNIVDSIYYFLAQGIFIFIYLLQLFASMFSYNHSLLLFKPYILIFIICLNVFFILSIVYSIKSLKVKNELNEKLLIDQSTFYILGQSVSHILHQWKIPLSRLSNHVSLIESLLVNKSNELEKVINSKLPSIKYCVEHINDTINDFSDFNTYKNNLVIFVPHDTIVKILILLDAKIKLTNIEIILNVTKELKVAGHEHMFSNIMLILINNAIEAFQTNEYHKNPRIAITILLKNEKLLIFIKDNAGGIQIKPIEKIFEYFSTTKENGSGIGLALVKLLVEEKLKGYISVKNTENGALFKVNIPTLIS